MIMGTKNATEDLAEPSRLLEGAHPREILAWAVERFFPRLTMATAFGAEGCVLLHMLAEIEPRVRVFNLDTGYQFAETSRLRDRIAERYGIEVEMVRPDASVDRIRDERMAGRLLVRFRPVLLSIVRSCRCDVRSWAMTPGSRRSAPTNPRRDRRADAIGWDGQVRPGEDQPALALDEARRLGVYRDQRRAV